MDLLIFPNFPGRAAIIKLSLVNDKIVYFYLLEPSETDWKNHCSASIISDTVLMTAAHCLRNHNSKNFQVLLGQSHLNSETFGQFRQLKSISRVEQHPKYDNKSGKLLKGLVIYENVVVSKEFLPYVCIHFLSNLCSQVIFGCSVSVYAVISYHRICVKTPTLTN